MDTPELDFLTIEEEKTYREALRILKEIEKRRKERKVVEYLSKTIWSKEGF